jgi:hypothetical protein
MPLGMTLSLMPLMPFAPFESQHDLSKGAKGKTQG